MPLFSNNEIYGRVLAFALEWYLFMSIHAMKQNSFVYALYMKQNIHSKLLS